MGVASVSSLLSVPSVMHRVPQCPEYGNALAQSVIGNVGEESFEVSHKDSIPYAIKTMCHTVRENTILRHKRKLPDQLEYSFTEFNATEVREALEYVAKFPDSLKGGELKHEPSSFTRNGATVRYPNRLVLTFKSL